MEKFKIIGIGIDPASGKPFVILSNSQEEKPIEELVLPIWVSKIDANLIANALHTQKRGGRIQSTPYDLTLRIVEESNFEIRKILIQQAVKRTFHASIIIFDRNLGLEKIIDSRPSDCIILSIKRNLDIFVASRVIQQNCLPAILPGTGSNNSLLFRKITKKENLDSIELDLKEKKEFSKFLKNVKASDFKLPPQHGNY